MEYFQKVQNAIRPIFLSEINNPCYANIRLRFQNANAIYIDTVRLIVPEATRITTTSAIGNISLNLLNSTHRMYLTMADVENDLGITNTFGDNVPSANKFFVKLNNDNIKTSEK